MTAKHLADFPLNWRWTEEQYDQLPDAHLARIFPVSVEVAQRLWKLSTEFSEGTEFRPSAEYFHRIVALDQPHSTDQTEDWIRGNLNPQQLDLIQVWVSWQPDLAVQTDMEIVARYWETFCYEASDDTAIFPDSIAWVMHYWHEDRLYFAAKESTGLGG